MLLPSYLCKCFGMCSCSDSSTTTTSTTDSLKAKLIEPLGSGSVSSIDSDESSEQAQQQQQQKQQRRSEDAIHELFNELGLDLVNKLATGGFGNVFGATLTVNTLKTLQEATPIDDWSLDEMASNASKLVAIKVIDTVHNADKFSRFWTEACALDRLAHPNIVRHYGHLQVFVREEHDSFSGYRFRVSTDRCLATQLMDEQMLFVIFMERLGMSLNSLRRHLKISYFEEHEVVNIVQQIGLALAYMHETFAIAHNQLSLDNIMVAPVAGQYTRIDRENWINFRLKLIHFGQASIHSQYEYQQAMSISARLMIDSAFGHRIVFQQSCTIEDVPPNVFLQEAYNFGRLLLTASLICPTSLPSKCLRLMVRRSLDRLTVADAIVILNSSP